MFCKECGNNVDEKAIIRTKCGKDVDDEAVICIHCGCSIIDDLQNKNITENGEKINKKTILIAVVCGIIILFVLCIGVLLSSESEIKTIAKSLATKRMVKGYGYNLVVCEKVEFIKSIYDAECPHWLTDEGFNIYARIDKYVGKFTFSNDASHEGYIYVQDELIYVDM